MGGAIMSDRRVEVRDFLSELKTQKLLVNGDLEEAIRSQVDRGQVLNGEQCYILTRALGEMNRREIGVYTSACILIAAINSFPRK